MKRLVGLVIGLLIVGIGGHYFYQYEKEHNLADIIYYDSDDLLIVGLTADREEIAETEAYEWLTEDKKQIDHIFQFLSTYKVKRVSNDYYQTHYLGDSRQEIFISHYKQEPSIVFWGEYGVQMINGKTYEVLNGPIDLNWSRQYISKQKKDR